MAEAGPNTTSSILSASSTPLPPSSALAPPSRPTHIHFPGDAHSSGNGSHTSIHALGLGPPPTLRSSNNQGGSLSFQQDDRRRRVKSVDASSPFDQFRNRDGHPSSPSRRAMSFSRKGEQRDVMSSAVPMDTFSDEFDLCECASLPP